MITLLGMNCIPDFFSEKKKCCTQQEEISFQLLPSGILFSFN
jgi:hypothetical protein